MEKKNKKRATRKPKLPPARKSDVEVSAVKFDLKGIGEAAPHAENVLKSMLNAIRRGIGTWYAPIGRVREAEADRAIANVRADAILDVTRKQSELRKLERKLRTEAPSLGGRAMTRLVEETLRTQANREEVARYAVEHLVEHPPSRDAVGEISDDWLTQFWDVAEKIGSAEIQLFYGRILARNAEAPDTTSPITLRVLSTLTSRVATRFEHFCRLSIREGGSVYVIHPNTFVFQNIGPLDEFGVTYDDLFEFESYGLIRSAETISTNHTSDPPDEVTDIDYAGQPGGLAFNKLQIHRLMFTRAGSDIRNSLHLSPVAEYTAALVKKLSNAFYPQKVSK